MAAFVQSTVDMVSINVADDETGEKTYNLVLGGESLFFFFFVPPPIPKLSKTEPRQGEKSISTL